MLDREFLFDIFFSFHHFQYLIPLPSGLHCVLAININVILLYVKSYPTFVAFKNFSLFWASAVFDNNVCERGSFCDYSTWSLLSSVGWMYRLIFFIEFGEFSTITSLSVFSALSHFFPSGTPIMLMLDT